MTTERDSDTRIVLSWLREDAHENAERVLLRALDEVDATPQRRSWWPARRDAHMNIYAKVGAAAAAVLVVVVVGYELFPGRSGPGGSPATPSPSPSLIARGTFITPFGTVDLDATRAGSTVTGHMTLSPNPPDDESSVRPAQGEEEWGFTVDLQCTRTSEDGVITIGGLITDSTASTAPVGTWAAISLKRGSPVQAMVSYMRGGHPIAYAPSCLASLDAEFGPAPTTFGRGNPWLQPIEGSVELGP